MDTEERIKKLEARVKQLEERVKVLEMWMGGSNININVYPSVDTRPPEPMVKYYKEPSTTDGQP